MLQYNNFIILQNSYLFIVEEIKLLNLNDEIVKIPTIIWNVLIKRISYHVKFKN